MTSTPKFLAFAILLIALVSCGGSDKNKNIDDVLVSDNSIADVCDPFKIVGGQQCDIQNTALVRILTDGLCTGTVISQNLILTAAHCFNGRISDITVVALSGDFTAALNVFILSDWVESQFQAADVALLEVDPEFISRNNLRNLPLLKLRNSQPDLASSNFFVSGYGLNPGDNLNITSLPVSARMNLVEYDIDSGVIVMEDTDTSTGNACTGDSGAPLVIQPPTGGSFIVGVVSSGVFSNDCTRDNRTRFVDISNPFAISLLNQFGL